MKVVKQSRKVRIVCSEVADNQDKALTSPESFSDKFPHPAAVKDKVFYSYLDYDGTTALGLSILP